MKKSDKNLTDKQSKQAKDLPGYPLYPDNEDIYRRSKEEENIDPENPDKTKPLNEVGGRLNEKDFKQDKSGNDLDVPGAELDDEQENIGSEDEENNLYSLGDTE